MTNSILRSRQSPKRVFWTDEQWQAFDRDRLSRRQLQSQLDNLGVILPPCGEESRVAWSESEREELRTGVPVERQVDGLSPDGSCEAPHASPSSTLRARVLNAALYVVGALVIAAVAIPVAMAMLAFVVGGLLISLAEFLLSINGDDHGPYCGCDRCICPDCRMAQIECECQRGDA